jgi:6-phosphofructokinase 1
LGGTILGTSRTNVMRMDNGVDLVKQTMGKLSLESLVAIGGDDTLGVANHLQKLGYNVVGVPKTIDNDLCNTDYTFGFDSATNIAMRSLDDIKYTAMSHRRILVVELMGRHTGWIAVQAGIAGNAHVVAIPEFPISLDEICDILDRRHKSGKTYSVVAVAEAANIVGLQEEEPQLGKDVFGNIAMDERGIAERLSRAIKAKTGIPTRSVVLGHLQRGGNPSCFDRVLAARMGYCAAEQVVKKNYGVMVGIHGTDMVTTPLEAVLGKRKEVD